MINHESRFLYNMNEARNKVNNATTNFIFPFFFYTLSSSSICFDLWGKIFLKLTSQNHTKWILQSWRGREALTTRIAIRCEKFMSNECKMGLHITNNFSHGQKKVSCERDSDSNRIKISLKSLAMVCGEKKYSTKRLFQIIDWAFTFNLLLFTPYKIWSVKHAPPYVLLIE